MFAFVSSCLLNISNVSYSNSLDRLNGLSPYQKFVPASNACVQALFSKACVVEIKLHHSITDKSYYFHNITDKS